MAISGLNQPGSMAADLSIDRRLRLCIDRQTIVFKCEQKRVSVKDDWNHRNRVISVEWSKQKKKSMRKFPRQVAFTDDANLVEKRTLDVLAKSSKLLTNHFVRFFCVRRPQKRRCCCCWRSSSVPQRPPATAERPFSFLFSFFSSST